MGSGTEQPRPAGNRSRFLAVTTAVLLAVAGRADTAQASTEVFVYNSVAATMRTFQGGMVAGVTYKTLGSPITFNALGFIDLMDNPPGNDYHYYYGPSDGLHGSYEVGIWLNSAPGTLLASTVVTTDSTSIGVFRYAPIPATTIPANTDFTIAALLPDTMLDAWLYDTVSVNSPDITGSGAGKTLSGATSLTFPTGAGFGSGTAIVNATTAVVAPEPTSAALLLLAGGGFGLWWRRRG